MAEELKRQKVLIVDDTPENIHILRDILKEAYTILAAVNGARAIKIATTDPVPDIILLDVMMPDIDGYEVCAKLKADAKTKNIPIIFITALNSEANEAKGLEFGAVDYITKPFSPVIVKSRLHNHLELKKYQDRLEELVQEQTRELIQLTDALVETMVTTLDTRDATTVGHSKRLAGYAVKLAEAVTCVDYGKYKEVVFTEDQLKELYYAALLHDIGKIGVKESILQKKYRLSEERQSAITYRFNYYKKYLELKKLQTGLSAVEMDTLTNIDTYLQFIIKISQQSYITPTDSAKIKEVAQIEFTDVDATDKRLLDDFEVESLTIVKGNLTNEERKIINSHVEHTYNILKGIPWLKNLENVPEIAANHHERINGKGYIRGLTGDEIPVQSKILAILDIFEALTALDRPYKPTMPVEKALKILQEEVNLGQLDSELFDIFVKEQVYNLYKTELPV